MSRLLHWEKTPNYVDLCSQSPLSILKTRLEKLQNVSGYGWNCLKLCSTRVKDVAGCFLDIPYTFWAKKKIEIVVYVLYPKRSSFFREKYPRTCVKAWQLFLGHLSHFVWTAPTRPPPHFSPTSLPPCLLGEFSGCKAKVAKENVATCATGFRPAINRFSMHDRIVSSIGPFRW